MSLPGTFVEERKQRIAGLELQLSNEQSVNNAQSILINSLLSRIGKEGWNPMSEDINKTKDPPTLAGSKAACEVCKSDFTRIDSEHVCPACMAYASKKRDWKVFLLALCSLFALVQTPLINVIYYYVGKSNLPVEVQVLLAVFGGGIVVLCLQTISKMYGVGEQELKDQVIYLQNELDKSKLREQFASSAKDDAINRLQVVIANQK